MSSVSADPVVIEKGMIVKSIRFDFSALVIAKTKDGKRMLVHHHDGRDDKWYPLDWFTVEIDGPETCWKCNGSGNFYMGGAVVNGVYTGKIGKCFGCGGKGKADNSDRLRNHIYFRDFYTVSV